MDINYVTLLKENATFRKVTHFTLNSVDRQDLNEHIHKSVVRRYSQSASSSMIKHNGNEYATTESERISTLN